MNRLAKEVAIFLSVLLLSIVSNILNNHNTMIIYLLVRVWVEILDLKD